MVLSLFAGTFLHGYRGLNNDWFTRQELGHECWWCKLWGQDKRRHRLALCLLHRVLLYYEKFVSKRILLNNDFRTCINLKMQQNNNMFILTGIHIQKTMISPNDFRKFPLAEFHHPLPLNFLEWYECQCTDCLMKIQRAKCEIGGTCASIVVHWIPIIGPRTPASLIVPMM